MDNEMIDGLPDKIAKAMQQVRDEIGATEQQRIAFAYAEAAMRTAIAREQARLNALSAHPSF